MTARTQKQEEVFRTRAVRPEVAEERGYRRYGGSLGLDPIFEVDSRYATESIEWKGNPRSPIAKRRVTKTQTLKAWLERQTRGGVLPGWVMPKHALPGSPFDAPLAQLRPDVPVPKGTWTHSHADEPKGVLERHLASKTRQKEHAGLEAQGVILEWEKHRHKEEAKYLLPPGPHGKRWDTHPRCTPDRLLAAERVFLHLEGTLKLDALVSAGEVGADVPSVTLWDRGGALSYLDWPDGDPRESMSGGRSSFFEAWAELEPLLIALETQQQEELSRFLDAYVRAPVIVLCDRDWRDNPMVTLEAFSLRDVVRDAGFECVVAAPPGASKGSDDFLFRGGKVDNLRVIEPVPHKAPGRAAFEREYRRERASAGTSGRRRPSATVERELMLLDWYATHATEDGRVRRPVRRIADRLGVSQTTVKRDTLTLAEAGALIIEGHYHDPDAPRDNRRRRSGRRPPPATVQLREDLIPPRRYTTVARWVRSLT